MPVDVTDRTVLLISAVATLVATCAALISYAVYRSQSDADVVVYAEADELRPSIINLIIKNIGKAPAYDVKFMTSVQLPSEAFGLDSTASSECKVMRDGPIINGIPFLPPESKRVITWGQYGGLYSALGEGTVCITARYKSRHFGIPRKIRNEQFSMVEILSLKGTDASSKNYEKQIADNIKELVKVAAQIAKKIA